LPIEGKVFHSIPRDFSPGDFYEYRAFATGYRVLHAGPKKTTFAETHR
jgi:hypothetical protein